MRKFNVSVNGKSYSVEVEEVGGSASAAVSAPVAAQPAAAPAAPKASASQGGAVVAAPMPGVVRKLSFASGASVKAGQPVVVLEAMKMENDIVASADGVITYAVNVGDSVETDAVLAYVK